MEDKFDKLFENKAAKINKFPYSEKITDERFKAIICMAEKYFNKQNGKIIKRKNA